MNREVCEVIKNIVKKQGKKICYVMVGSGQYVDDELEPELIIKTGFVDLDEFNCFVEYADVVVNLRMTTMGETSGAMLRILQIGKVCITNNGGWFSEIPDECVCKIELDEVEDNLERALVELVENDSLRQEIGKHAKKYISEEFNGEVIAEQVYEFVVGNN